MPSSCTDPEPIGPRRTPSTRRESIEEKRLRLLRSLRTSALALITTQESIGPRRTPSTRSKTMQEKSADALNRRLLKPGTVLEWMVHPSPTGRRPREVPKGRSRAAPERAFRSRLGGPHPGAVRTGAGRTIDPVRHLGVCRGPRHRVALIRNLWVREGRQAREGNLLRKSVYVFCVLCGPVLLLSSPLRNLLSAKDAKHAKQNDAGKIR